MAKKIKIDGSCNTLELQSWENIPQGSCLRIRPCDYCDSITDISVYANPLLKIYRNVCKTCAEKMEI